MRRQDMKTQMLMTLLLLALHCSLVASQTPYFRTDSFSQIDGFLCINTSFVEQYREVQSSIQCAGLCNLNQRCQAFTTADGWCQLFVFDKCSKTVRDCNCTRRGKVFVKSRTGLQPGTLCPSGYGDVMCGVKYKLIGSSIVKWSQGRQACESDSGLVIMADVIDATEMAQVNVLYAKYNPNYLWLGGYQTPGSPEPAGGWYWVGCNITVEASLWVSGEPNNQIGAENAVANYGSNAKLMDTLESPPDLAIYFFVQNNFPNTVLCECLSPFD